MLDKNYSQRSKTAVPLFVFTAGTTERDEEETREAEVEKC